MYPIAIMQGRLSPGQEGRFQFFPHHWEAEFPLAKELGFDGICWFLDHEPSIDDAVHQWQDPTFLEALDRARTILPITSVDAGSFSFSPADAAKSVERLMTFLPHWQSRLQTQTFNLPLLENTSLLGASEEILANAVTHLQVLADEASKYQLKIGLETDLPVAELRALIARINRKNVGVCYDIGNATSYEFDCPADLDALSDLLFEVHLKDRKRGTSASVPLGQGDADFAACMQTLSRNQYGGILTMQAFRDDASYMEYARTQKDFIKSYLIPS